MSSSTEDEIGWEEDTDPSTTSPNDATSVILRPRSYQLEMFEHSLQQNIIATMATGSGKSLIGCLRIQAALEAYPAKRIWFTTPNVLLAEQQHGFLTSQLPGYSFRLITGADNVQFWGSQAVWDAVLLGRHGVISTPEVLRAALGHAFVSLETISLLVFDEAHHCMKANPTNLIMQSAYHPLRLRSSDPGVVPAVLGLTASPIMQSSIDAMQKLERNLNAVCRAPSLNIEEYECFVYMPQMEQLTFSRGSDIPSALLTTLNAVVNAYNVLADPTYLRLKKDTSLSGQQKFDKIVETQKTPIVKELTRFQNQAYHIHAQLGTWAAERYITACVSKLDHVLLVNGLIFMGDSEKQHLYSTLAPVRAAMSKKSAQLPEGEIISHKVRVLTSFLVDNFSEDMTCIVFVTRRATSWALNELLAALPKLQQIYRSFALVGSSNVAERGLADLVDCRRAQECLEGFRQGEFNLCVATSVLEEGIDVQACNSVICFDDSDNVKSFIQRRGRARRKDSKYVFMQDPTEPSTRYSEYQALEAKMKQAYEDQDRQVAELKANENTDEHCDWKYSVESTGAVLSISQARSHVHHFCNKLPRREGRAVPEPVFLVTGTPGVKVSCRVVLPASLPSHLQVSQSTGKWLNQKMAKNDAAFQACVALHKHGLLTDNLLPPSLEKEDMTIEGRDSMYEVKAALNSWSLAKSATGTGLYAHHIAINGGEVLPGLILLLPRALEQIHDIKLHTATGVLTAKITFIDGPRDINPDIAIQTTKLLFGAALRSRLPGLNGDGYKLPYLLVPDIDPFSLPAWVRESQAVYQLVNYNFLESSKASYLVQRRGDSVPYFYSPSDLNAPPALLQSEDQIEVTRLVRFSEYLLPTSLKSSNHTRLLDVNQCTISGLDPGYVKSMAFIPSIMQVVEISLRAASCELLAPVGFHDHTLVAAALTAPGAGPHDYQRLEFIGDSLLKYLTSVNLFCLHQEMPESHLTVLRAQIISNGRLQRATRDLGLDEFLTTQGFSTKKWTLAEKIEPDPPRTLSSKILADIIEALIGAAYVDGGDEPEGLSKVLKCFHLLLPDMPWEHPGSVVRTLKFDSVPDENGQLCQVEALIGYKFTNRGLLLEALTHSTIEIGRQSYERLEYLGDTVLDIIIKERLWRSPLEMTEGQLTERSSALVNGNIFAYFTTKIATELEVTDVDVELRTKEAAITKRVERVCLHDYMTRLPNQTIADKRIKYLERYENVKEKLDDALKMGKVFPWVELYHLAAPKWCSDVLESIIGAVYIDSGADLKACEAVLRQIGLMELVERAAREPEIVYAQPLRILRELASYLKVQNRIRPEGKANVYDCRLKIEEQELGIYCGASCKAEAESRAAEIVLKKIGNGGVVLTRRSGAAETTINTDIEGEQQEQQEDDEIENDSENVVSLADQQLKRKRAAIAEDDIMMNGLE